MQTGTSKLDIDVQEGCEITGDSNELIQEHSIGGSLIIQAEEWPDELRLWLAAVWQIRHFEVAIE